MKRGFREVANNPSLYKSFIERLDGGIDTYLRHVREGVQCIYQDTEEVIKVFEMMRDPEKFEELREELSSQAVHYLDQTYALKRD